MKILATFATLTCAACAAIGISCAVDTPTPTCIAAASFGLMCFVVCCIHMGKEDTP